MRAILQTSYGDPEQVLVPGEPRLAQEVDQGLFRKIVGGIPVGVSGTSQQCRVVKRRDFVNLADHMRLALVKHALLRLFG